MATKKRVKKDVWVMVSGGFDPIHIGHVRMFEQARMLGDKLVVVINNDNWLRSKKGYVFMSSEERKEIISMFPFVDKVVLTSHKKDDTDRSVCRELAKIKPDIFANGGDRKSTKDIPESAVCKELGIKMVFNVGAGGKVQSSSWLARDASRNFARSVRAWGEFYGWDAGKNWKLKTMYLKRGGKVSMQYHEHRSEHWMLVEGDAQVVLQHADGKTHKTEMKKGEVMFVDAHHAHQLSSKGGGIIVEVSLGDFDENDVVRVESNSRAS